MWCTMFWRGRKWASIEEENVNTPTLKYQEEVICEKKVVSEKTITKGQTYIGKEVNNCLGKIRRHLRKPLPTGST